MPSAGAGWRLDAATHEAADAARREAASGARELTLRGRVLHFLETLAAPGDGVLERWLGIPLTLIADPARPHGPLFPSTRR